MSSLRAFREEFIRSGAEAGGDFAAFDSRRVRYAIQWSFYENDAYRNINDWAVTYKTAFGLYKFIRNIYNPSYRVGEFYKSHLWGGPLDSEAGDTGALPIVTDNDAIRPHISRLWQWSNWSTNKDVTTLKGTVLGDAVIRVIDDVEAKKVYLEYVNPAIVESLTVDAYGHIKGYTITETRAHPNTGKDVQFKEVVSRDGQLVVYRTYLNGSPYAWNGQAEEWAESYGFVPMVHIEHNNVGLDWGWSEMHPARSKIHEVDDLASMLSDQARKSINPFWLFSGVRRDENKTVKPTGASTDYPETGREQAPALYATDPAAKAQALVAPLDFPGVIQHITEILKELERDYPELKFDALRAAGELSGTALRIARQPVETKVNQRRASYDNGLVRAQQMALTIGGLRGIFPGISLDSFDRGALDHAINARSVFSVDPVDKLEEDKVRAEVIKLYVDAGASIKAAAMVAGLDEETALLLSQVDLLGAGDAR